MSQKEKLIKKIYRLPKDFTFDELKTLFSYLGFEVENKGKTSGSRIKFYNEKNYKCNIWLINHTHQVL